MLDIIGNIKIDLANHTRINYLIACLKSWDFFKDHCRIFLLIEGANTELTDRLNKEVPGTYLIPSDDKKLSYGKKYVDLLSLSENPFVLNFIEDHFTLIDDKDFMLGLLNCMKEKGVDVLKSSFFQIEQNSSKTLKRYSDTEYGRIFLHDERNHEEYQRHYVNRYYMGVNFITTRAFALKFWDRDMGNTPHPYELSSYSREWEYRCMIPSREIQCAVEDNHGEDGTCILMRKEEKWDRIFYKKEDKKPQLTKHEHKQAVNDDEVILKESQKNDENILPVTYIISNIVDSSSELLFNDIKSENDLFSDKISIRFLNVIKSGTGLLGKQCIEMEERMANLVGKKYCIAVKNGTDAIILAVKYALRKIQPNAPVIIPNFGAYPTAIAVKNCTDNIYFVDVDHTMTMDVNKLPDVKNGIIIPVHLFGNNCDMKRIKQYAKENNHIIIEDCAQSLGSGSGQHGLFSCFSFYPTKPLGTIGDGGAICTDDKEAFEEISSMRFYGIKKGVISDEGINSRMGELECAVINTKMYMFQKLSERRMVIASRYKKIVDGIKVNSNCIFHQFTVLFNERDKIISDLKKSKIPFMIHYPEHISNMPVFNYLGHKVGFKVSDKIISLPCHPFMPDNHIHQIEEFLKAHKQYEY